MSGRGGRAGPSFGLVAAALVAACGGGGESPAGPVAAIAVPSAATARVAPGGSLSFEATCQGAAGPVVHAWTFPGGTPAAHGAAIAGPVRFAEAGAREVSYRCTDGGGRSSTATRRVVVEPLAALFQVQLQFAGGAEAYQADALWAVDRLARVLRGPAPGLPPDPSQPDRCDGLAMATGEGHLAVLFTLQAMDGAAGALALSGPCVLRRSDGLPIAAAVRIDAADAAALQAAGRLRPLILHELLHAVGFGALWPAPAAGRPGLGLLAGITTTDPYYTGREGRAAFRDFENGPAWAGMPVPVEAGGGEATRAGHWRAAVFGDELMTGSLSGSLHPLGRTTAASLADLGWVVDAEAADPFLILQAAPASAGHPLDLGEDVDPTPPTAR